MFNGKLLSAIEASDVDWIVNDSGELGVKIAGRCVFIYKGSSFEYKDGRYGDGAPVMHRAVGKREFGEVCWPQEWVRRGYGEDRYTVNLTYRPGLSFGNQDDPAFHWNPLPSFKPESGDPQ